MRMVWWVMVVCLAWRGSSVSAQDLVRFHDGGIVRGRVIEWRPGQTLVMESEAGDEVRAPADQVAEVVLGDETNGDTTEDDDSSEDDDTTAEDDDGFTGQVRIGWDDASSHHARAIRWTDGQASDGCVLPCSLDVSDTIDLRIVLDDGRPRVPAHHVFSLENTSALRLEYEDRSTARIVGIVLTSILGTLSLGFGIGGLIGNAVNPGSGDLYLMLAAPIAGGLALLVGPPAIGRRDHLDLVAVPDEETP